MASEVKEETMSGAPYQRWLLEKSEGTNIILKLVSKPFGISTAQEMEKIDVSVKEVPKNA